jgi:AraC-like DNA-binding protein
MAPAREVGVMGVAVNAQFNRQMATRFWGGLLSAGKGPETASLMFDGYAGEKLRLASFDHAPHVFSSDQIALAYREGMLVSRHLQGDADIEQHGRQARIAAGDFCLVDLTRPFRIEIHGATVQTIYLSASLLRDCTARLADAAALSLPGDLPAAAYLRALFDQIFSRTDSLTEAVADRLADAMPHVLATALTELAETDAPTPTRLRQHHQHQVRRYAREHLSNPALCAEMIARGVGLSTSYVFELFANEPTTLMRWVRQERLARCQRELSSPQLRHRSIGQLAYAWGFGDLTHFSRAFRDQYGVSPRNYRQSIIGALKTVAVLLVQVGLPLVFAA